MIIAPSQFAPLTAAAVYTNSTAGEVLIDYCVARNNDASTQVLSIYSVPSGSVADTSTLRLAVSIPAGQTYICTEIVGDVLAGNESLWLAASAASTIAIKISGRLRTV